ncbi:MAG: BamA/TamA family outer membrane protein [Desulfatibacillaceae bacterium]|nr:BamA/TamA family outer membrane protein [Desulfatibacillaceae bacterium]
MINALRILLGLFAVFWLCAVGFGPGAFAGQVDEPDTWSVRKVRIEGLEELSPRPILAILWSRPAPWKPWAAKQEYEPDQADLDRDKIIKYLEAQGFYDAAVSVEIEKDPSRQLVDLTFYITEGPFVSYTQVVFEGRESLPPKMAQEIEALARIEPGQRLVVEKYQSAKARMVAYLKNNGYPRARVEGSVSVYLESHEASASFRVIPGQFCVFGPVSVSSLADTQPKVLLSRLAFKPGQAYSLAKIHESQQRLFALGYFSSVSIEPETSAMEQPGCGFPDSPCSVPMTLSGNYRKLRGVKVGIGYGTQDQLRFQASWSHRHVADLGQRFEVGVKASAIKQNLEAVMDWPYFLRGDQQMSNSLGISREDEVSFVVRKLYNRFTVNRNLGGPYFVQAGHMLEINRPESLPADELWADIREDANYLISYGRIGFGRDTRSSVLNPKWGSLVQGGFSYASSVIGSEIQFMQIDAEARKIWPLWGRWLLAGRMLFSFIEPVENTDHIPIFKRLFSGGSQSVRGYAYQELGPKDVFGDPLGGLSLAESSLELRFPIYRDLGGVIFTDAGSVLADSFSFDYGALRYASGLGLRYDTPVGPLRIDWGYQLNPQDPGRTHHRFYFSIGQAF